MPNFMHERLAGGRVAGVDEAGRGPLAGPVVAAAVVLPVGQALDGVRDSKQMTPEQRDEAFDRIHACALGVGVGIADTETIDRFNILRASHHAMREALTALPVRPDHALIDGRPVHPFPILQTALVKGDSRSVSIAAASVIAKVTRDRMMVALDAQHPEYGFALHKGYATPEHLASLERFGPCVIHRRSFAPVARLLGPEPGEPQQALTFDEGDRQQTGMAGEVVAASHLRALGWTILCERFRCREGEIDLIAREREMLVFVEVKTLRGRGSAPAEAVNRSKRVKLLAAAETWLAENGLDCACRFDVAEVRVLPTGYATVDVIHDAFRPGE
jgi:ribonuclease HII